MSCKKQVSADSLGPVASSLDLVGDRWTLVLIRDLLFGNTRFGEFLLSDRLEREGVERQNVARRTGDAEGVLDLLWLLAMTVLAWVRPRQDLVLENLLLRHQLTILTRPTRAQPRARLRAWDTLLWVLARRFCASWRDPLTMVTPETVVRWRRQGWRLFWRWKSRSRGGRPHLSPAVRALIVTMSRENPLWGTERIRGELLKLGIVVSNRSIRRYRWRGPRRPSSQTWRTFLRNHAHHLWATDLFTVPTLTFKTLYVLIFIAHGRRELMHVNVTANPSAAWVWRQVIEATPLGTEAAPFAPRSRYCLWPRLPPAGPPNRLGRSACRRRNRDPAP